MGPPHGGVGAIASEWLALAMTTGWSLVWLSAMTFIGLPASVLHRVLFGPPQRREFKSILITGASSGIGAALARAYAAPGVTLVLTARRADRLADVKKACEEKGAVVKVVAVDVTDQKAMEKHILEADRELPLDLVIANAGVEESAFFDKCDSYLSGAQVPVTNTNVMGVVYTTTPIIDRMRARRSGQIVIMSSIVGLCAMPDSNQAAYAASKTWARTYALGLRGSVQSDGVGVTAILPAFVETEMTDYIGADDPDMKLMIKYTGLKVDDAVARMKRAIAVNTAVLILPYGLIWTVLSALGNNVVTPSALMWYRWLKGTSERPRGGGTSAKVD